MLTAGIVYRFFVCSSTGDDDLLTDWTMIYNHNMVQELPNFILPISRDMVN